MMKVHGWRLLKGLKPCLEGFKTRKNIKSLGFLKDDDTGHHNFPEYYSVARDYFMLLDSLK